MLSPLVRGQEYRIAISVRQGIEDGEEFTAYGYLYRRATASVNARIAELTCSDGTEHPHAWIVAHTWLSHGVGPHNMAGATITMGVVFPKEGDAGPQGAQSPTAEELRVPGGSTLEMLAERYAAGDAKLIDEIYNDFDFRDSAGASPEIVTFSYGEYVPESRGINFEPYLERAEKRAKFHRDLLRGESSIEPLRIIKREWLCATDPDIAVVHVYFQV